MDVEHALDRLARDREHGASEITARALEALAALARQAEDPLEAIAAAGTRLIHAHPAMAPLVNLVDQLLATWREEGADAPEILRREAQRRVQALARNGAELIEAGDRVATYSRSGTVLAALARASDAERSLSALVSEGRPGNEGVTVARELANAGIQVVLTTDIALPMLVADADHLLVGADALCAEGLVNKTGTGVLLREAARAGVPAHVLAGTDKLLPPSYAECPALTTNASMGHDLPEGVREENPLFECTPLDPIAGVVTERGRWTPDQVRQHLHEHRLDPGLAARLDA